MNIFDFNKIYEKIIVEISSDENISTILKTKKVSEDFLRKYVNQFTNSDWEIISGYQDNLSKSFINDFKDKLNWLLISRWQKNIDNDFIEKFKRYINFEQLNLNKNVNQNLKDRWKYSINIAKKGKPHLKP